MLGKAAILPAKTKFKQMYHLKSARGISASWMPKKEGNKDFGEVPEITAKKTDPIVAFSKPPPLPPVFGPLVALSLLDSWWSRDSNEDLRGNQASHEIPEFDVACKKWDDERA